MSGHAVFGGGAVIRLDDHDACWCGHMRADHAPGIKGTDAASHCRSYFTVKNRRGIERAYPCECDEFRRDKARLRTPQSVAPRGEVT